MFKFSELSLLMLKSSFIFFKYFIYLEFEKVKMFYLYCSNFITIILIVQLLFHLVVKLLFLSISFFSYIIY